MKRITTFVALVILLGFAVTASAHHGTGISYSNSELITKKATVTSLEFKNPHVALFFDTKDENGKVTPFEVKVGDKVLISKYGGTEVKIDDQKFTLVREDDILGVIG